jgi:transmembrane 9 superfamily protein 2/4
MSSSAMPRWLLVLLAVTALVLSSSLGVEAFYLPGSYLHPYADGDKLGVKVNSITSIETELPYSYYSLPFCQPKEGIKKVAENIGELLMGDEIENSPYVFRMRESEANVKLCVTKPLTEKDVKHFQQRIDDYYQVNLILDNLPVTRYTKQRDSAQLLRWTGSPIGFKLESDKAHYIYNHLIFKVLIHPYEGDTSVGSLMGAGDGLDAMPSGKDRDLNGTFMVVGFEVIPCSVVRDAKAASKLEDGQTLPPASCNPDGPHQAVKVDEQIVFSYDVTFETSDIRWPSRWDAYLKMEGTRVHWFSILNSLMVISFLAGIVFVIFLRTVRRDLTKYEELDKEAQSQMTEELSGWKLVVGDVFRVPSRPQLLSVVVGNGVQILCMAVVTIGFAALGFMSPASRGMLLVLGHCRGLRRIADMEHASKDVSGMESHCMEDSMFLSRHRLFHPHYPQLHSMGIWQHRCNSYLPVFHSSLVVVHDLCPSHTPRWLLWLPLRAHHLPRAHQPDPTRNPPTTLPVVLGAGTLPFGTLFIELFFIMSSIWMGRVYYVFGFLLIVLVLLVIVCAEVAVVLTYMHLCVEDHRWWWKSFFASGSVAFYVFLYSINYLVFDLHSLSGPVSAVLYVGYSLLMVTAIMFATGTIGFLTSFYFVHYLFSSVKLD